MNVNTILRKYRLKFWFTFSLILAEALIAVLFPLFIGYAIDSALNGAYNGALQLGALGVIALIVGVGRRVFDSRFYAAVYEDIGSSTISGMEEDASSKKSARLDMIRELVEFLENSLPELTGSIIGLIGVITVIATLNLNVFYGSLAVTFLVFLIYWGTSARTIRLNKSMNDEYEKQVDVIKKNDKAELKTHLKEMMKWNIKLSDLEAVNFSVSWLVMMAFLVMSVIVSADGGTVKYGVLFSLIMYVFQYIENVINLPFFYQSWLRLLEIKERLNTGQVSLTNEEKP